MNVSDRPSSDLHAISGRPRGDDRERKRERESDGTGFEKGERERKSYTQTGGRLLGVPGSQAGSRVN